MLLQWVDLIRSEIKRAWGRRGIRILALLSFGALLLLSGSNHKAASDYRATFDRSDARLSDPNGFEKSRSDYERGNREQAQPYYDQLTEEDFRERLQFDLRISRQELRSLQVNLHPKVSHLLTLGFFGTLPGVLFAVMAASTFVGAEFRWGYWKTAASAQPRRGRLVIGKLLAIWIALAVTLAALLALSYPVNAAASEIYKVGKPLPHSELAGEFIDPYQDPAGPPDFGSLLREYAVALLALCFYSTLAFVAVAWTRATLAGPLVSLGAIGLEGLATNMLSVTRHVVPAQQLAFLRSAFIDVDSTRVGGLWYKSVDSLGDFGQAQALSDIPDWRALLVLSIWLALLIAASVLALRSRDIPG